MAKLSQEEIAARIAASQQKKKELLLKQQQNQKLQQKELKKQKQKKAPALAFVPQQWVRGNIDEVGIDDWIIGADNGDGSFPDGNGLSFIGSNVAGVLDPYDHMSYSFN